MRYLGGGPAQGMPMSESPTCQTGGLGVTGLREPRYLKVKDHLVEMIDKLPTGVPIPPERDLAVTHETSRTTVRQAVTELVAEGRLVRRHGAGTFVAEPKLVWPLTISGFAEQAAAARLNVETTLLSHDRIPATPEFADRLNIRRGTQVLVLELLRSVNGSPMALERAHLAARRFPSLANALGRHGSLYEVLFTRFGVTVANAMETIETAPAAPREAALLETDTGTPMLLVTRHSHTADGEPVEWVRSWYRGDRYTFLARISRNGKA